MQTFFTNITNPVIAACFLFLFGIITYTIIASILYLRSIKKFSLEEARAVEKRSNENKPALTALIVANIFTWTIWRPQIEEKVSTSILIWITIGINLFLLFFIICTSIRTILARKRIREIESQLPNRT